MVDSICKMRGKGDGGIIYMNVYSIAVQYVMLDCCNVPIDSLNSKLNVIPYHSPPFAAQQHGCDLPE